MIRSSPGSRRLAAMMFTDMVGYSALTQRNEALALQLLEEHRKVLRPIFPKYGGKEIETAGDAFFVEFGSALDAVRCGIHIQKTLRERNSTVQRGKEICVRIGLHLGDVVHRGKGVHGDGVNIAARIEPLSEPGGICISEDIARQVQHKTEIIVQKLGKPDLKNIHLPVEVYKVVLPWGSKYGTIRQRVSFAWKSKRIRLLSVAAIVALGCVLIVVFLPLRSSSEDRYSIAVMPFRNISGEKDDEYFSDGITEDVIARLSDLGILRVASPTSVMRYKNTQKTIAEIGNELSVATILEGSVRRAGTKVRVVAQLIDVSMNKHLWGKTYDQEFEFAQIISIQTDMAEKIARALEAQISPVGRQRLARKGTRDPEAYDLYLKGRYHWNKRMPDHLRKSITFFEMALERDPRYAAAYAGLSDAYIILGDYNVLSPDIAYPRARAAAMDALAVDDEIPEAHTSLAYATMHHDWDWETAGREFRKAIAIDSAYAQARSWYALYLSVLGRGDEAFEEGKKAQLLEPFSAPIRTDVALVLFGNRKYDLAIEQCQKALELDPTFFAAYMLLGMIYEQKGMYRDAIIRFSELSSVSLGHPVTVAALARAYAVAGDTANAGLMLEVLEEKAREQYVSSYWMAAIYAGLQRNDRALFWLESAYKAHDGLLIFVNVDPRFDSLREERKFKLLLTQMGLEGVKPRQSSLSTVY